MTFSARMATKKKKTFNNKLQLSYFLNSNTIYVLRNFPFFSFIFVYVVDYYVHVKYEYFSKFSFLYSSFWVYLYLHSLCLAGDDDDADRRCGECNCHLQSNQRATGAAVGGGGCSGRWMQQHRNLAQQQHTGRSWQAAGHGNGHGPGHGSGWHGHRVAHVAIVDGHFGSSPAAGAQ